MPSDDASPELLRMHAELLMARELARTAQAEAQAAQAKALEAEARAVQVQAINADLLARNAHLELMNALMRRDKYGAKSERASRLIGQLELSFEELEADASEAESLAAQAAAKTTTVGPFTRQRGPRRDFPAHLEREKRVIPAPEQCPCCGSDELSHLPPDITKLDL
jgi:transposase